MDTLEKHTDLLLSETVYWILAQSLYMYVSGTYQMFNRPNKATAGREIDYAYYGLLNYSGLGNIKQQLQAAIMKIVRIQSRLKGLNKPRHPNGKGQGKL